MKRLGLATTGFPDLPDEMLQICFARLPLEDLPKLRVICKRWHKLSNAHYLRLLRQEHGLTQTCTFTLDNKYIRGQYKGLEGIATDIKSSKVHSIATLRSPQRLQFGVAGINGQIYVLGGRSPLICSRNPAKAWTVYSRVDVYEPLSNSWCESQPMEVARHGFATGAVLDTGRSTIIVAGGYNAEGETLSSAEVYDFGKGRWEGIPGMIAISGACRGVVFEGKFLVQRANAGRNAVEVYDSVACRWMAFDSELSEFNLKPSTEANATARSVVLDL